MHLWTNQLQLWWGIEKWQLWVYFPSAETSLFMLTDLFTLRIIHPEKMIWKNMMFSTLKQYIWINITLNNITCPSNVYFLTSSLLLYLLNNNSLAMKRNVFILIVINGGSESLHPDPKWFWFIHICWYKKERKYRKLSSSERELFLVLAQRISTFRPGITNKIFK